MKAQIRILESVAVLIIFFILLVIGSSIYFGIQNSKVSKELRVQESVEVLRAGIKLQSLTELDCSFASAHTINCFDLYKLQAFSDLVKEEGIPDFYYSMFGSAVINVSVLFPFEKSFVIYDIHPEKFTSLIKKRMPVLIYDPIHSKYYFGVSELIKYA